MTEEFPSFSNPDPTRIVLVEDEALDRAAVMRALGESTGAEFVEIATAAEARERLPDPGASLVLLDVNLNGDSGLDLLPLTGETPVIIMTGQGSEEIAVHALRAGAYDYVVKDISGLYLSTLIQRTRAVLDRRRLEMEKDRLIIELKSALDNVKTLSGLIPICSSCKKIRNDSGFWNHLEKYLSEHTEAQFSHGLCPDCFEDFNAEVTEFLEQQERDKEQQG